MYKEGKKERLATKSMRSKSQIIKGRIISYNTPSTDWKTHRKQLREEQTASSQVCPASHFGQLSSPSPINLIFILRETVIFISYFVIVESHKRKCGWASFGIRSCRYNIFQYIVWLRFLVDPTHSSHIC